MRPDKESPKVDRDLTRRDFIAASTIVSGIAISEARASGQSVKQGASAAPCSLTVNGGWHELSIEPRTTLLDLLREHLQMFGTKKGCDHWQCGACTVLVNGERIISCLSLAIAQDGASITTIEGLAQGDELHPMQAAFLEYDGFQCGFCTPAMLKEVSNGMPSAGSDLSPGGKGKLTDSEIGERIAGNICRCGAYPNIVAAIRAVHQSGKS
jgi:xanthine dehydrogenase YagT iron-sulfur-binding subunit